MHFKCIEMHLKSMWKDLKTTLQTDVEEVDTELVTLELVVVELVIVMLETVVVGVQFLKVNHSVCASHENRIQFKKK